MSKVIKGYTNFMAKIYFPNGNTVMYEYNSPIQTIKGDTDFVKRIYEDVNNNLTIETKGNKILTFVKIPFILQCTEEEI